MFELRSMVLAATTATTSRRPHPSPPAEDLLCGGTLHHVRARFGDAAHIQTCGEERNKTFALSMFALLAPDVCATRLLSRRCVALVELTPTPHPPNHSLYRSIGASRYNTTAATKVEICARVRVLSRLCGVRDENWNHNFSGVR